MNVVQEKKSNFFRGRTRARQIVHQQMDERNVNDTMSDSDCSSGSNADDTSSSDSDSNSESSNVVLEPARILKQHLEVSLLHAPISAPPPPISHSAIRFQIPAAERPMRLCEYFQRILFAGHLEQFARTDQRSFSQFPAKFLVRSVDQSTRTGRDHRPVFPQRNPTVRRVAATRFPEEFGGGQLPAGYIAAAIEHSEVVATRTEIPGVRISQPLGQIVGVVARSTAEGRLRFAVWGDVESGTGGPRGR